MAADPKKRWHTGGYMLVKPLPRVQFRMCFNLRQVGKNPAYGQRPTLSFVCFFSSFHSSCFSGQGVSLYCQPQLWVELIRPLIYSSWNIWVSSSIWPKPLWGITTGWRHLHQAIQPGSRAAEKDISKHCLCSSSDLDLDVHQCSFCHHHLESQLRQRWIGHFATRVPYLIQAIKEKVITSNVKN